VGQNPTVGLKPNYKHFHVKAFFLRRLDRIQDCRHLFWQRQASDANLVTQATAHRGLSASQSDRSAVPLPRSLCQGVRSLGSGAVSGGAEDGLARTGNVTPKGNPLTAPRSGEVDSSRQFAII
jgi:hypothetical protein